ncbi:restriction endonuclease subunit S [Chromatocurvus halotolerans]|uniref:Type I restriction enzyme S subunit n=1 Tax=Chromatocurvus halotolerans TaxID=1132028 RepID=A0A4R2KZW1_9GAMM|nr:restriction endonuclease subunit S [Chromatocurvus halotolerans]TCO75818.1 type I restriction enzyme S subunit [Chromatocurvus halotolerans]
MIRRRFKYFMPERNEFSSTGEETLLSVSEYYGVKPRAEAFDDESAESRAESLEGYRIVRAGDFVMNYMLAWKGAYGVSDHDGIVSPAYAVYKIDPTYADRRFIHHRLRSEHMRSVFRARSKGIIESRLRLYPDAFLSMELELPDLDTQKAIADFLDRETARIDQLIGKKQRLVELQKIRRLAEVTQLLCNGTRTPSTRKRSGLDWMDDIPGHWQWVRMKDVCSEVIDCKNRTPPQVDEGQYWVIRTTCIKEGQFVQSGGYPTDKDSYEEWTKRGKPSAGDVLITREAPMGEACLYPEDLEACLGQRMMLYRPNKKLMRASYIVHTIYSAIGQHYVGLRRKGSTVGHLRVPEVYNFPCLMPPLDEQDEILARLDANLDTYTALGEKIHASIDQLKEYRSALITAAVTGQIDVATWGKQGQTDRRLDQIEEDMAPREARA